MTTDLLTIAEAQIAEKQFKEIQAVKERIAKDKEVLQQAIDLVNSHTLYKRVSMSYGSCRYKYVLATEEMLKEDYLKEPERFAHKGITFHEDWDKGLTNHGVLEVNGENYYDIRFALNQYEKMVGDKQRNFHYLEEKYRELKKDLEQLHAAFPTLKQAIEEWQEWERQQNAQNE